MADFQQSQQPQGLQSSASQSQLTNGSSSDASLDTSSGDRVSAAVTPDSSAPDSASSESDTAPSVSNEVSHNASSHQPRALNDEYASDQLDKEAPQGPKPPAGWESKPPAPDDPAFVPFDDFSQRTADQTGRTVMALSFACGLLFGIFGLLFILFFTIGRNQGARPAMLRFCAIGVIVGALIDMLVLQLMGGSIGQLSNFTLPSMSTQTPSAF
ncbi:proline-rich domain-containing protein [Cryptobacterium curtum]|uniref:proline-rich domain-containing protein n=1 Tax=Cryptobacterium curtum TaxID=84163 RepID=UPI0028D3D465|nr:proline-rich domain-containing protein [Cryptobacterium curtum]